MADNVDRATRSRMMSRIGSSDTAPEIIVRSYLHRAGLRFRLHERALPGTPDVVLPKWRVALFVHGCFWHRHRNCRFAYTPKSNRRFWKTKFAANVSRDAEKATQLRRAGWRVLTIWECQLSPARLHRLAASIARQPSTSAR
jgi:DNA mismatch endonuclease (patch repair protein)